MNHCYFCFKGLAFLSCFQWKLLAFPAVMALHKHGRCSSRLRWRSFSLARLMLGGVSNPRALDLSLSLPSYCTDPLIYPDLLSMQTKRKCKSSPFSYQTRPLIQVIMRGHCSISGGFFFPLWRCYPLHVAS